MPLIQSLHNHNPYIKNNDNYAVNSKKPYLHRGLYPLQKYFVRSSQRVTEKTNLRQYLIMYKEL